MKIIKIMLVFLLFISMVSVSAYAEVDDSTGKINISNVAPEVIGLQFTTTSFYEGDVVYCSASIKDLNNDTLTLNASVYDENHDSIHPNYNFTTSQFVCSGDWTAPLGKFCYVGITNITGNVGVWRCKFTASDGITNTSATATANEISIVPTTTTSPPSGEGGVGGYKPIDFDLKNLKINAVGDDFANVSFTIANKGFKNPIEIVVNQKITYLAELKIIAEDTRQIQLDVSADVETQLIPLQNFTAGLYQYEVTVTAVEANQTSAKSDTTFRYLENGQFVQQPQPTVFDIAVQQIQSVPITIWIIIIAIISLIIAFFVMRRILKK